MRVGIFGGSFDPVHNAHLRAAETCLGLAPLDVVLFVPAAAQPLKPQGPVASAEDRLRMLELALSGTRNFRISTLEIDRGGVSYTVETLRQLAHEMPHDELFLILGSDALRDLPHWREPQEICRLATLLVVDRPGADIESGPPGCQVRHIRMPRLDISSREIRARIRRDESVENLLPATVAAYIAEHGFYRGPSTP